MTITHQECGPFILNRQQCVISSWQFADAFGSDCSPFYRGRRRQTADGLDSSNIFFLNGATFRSLLRWRYAPRLLLRVDSAPLAGSQLCQKPGPCVQAFHGMRSLWWSWTASLTLFSFSSFLPHPSPLLYSPRRSLLLMLFLFVSPQPPFSLSFMSPLFTWTREPEPDFLPSNASGYCVHFHRVKDFLGFGAYSLHCTTAFLLF